MLISVAAIRVEDCLSLPILLQSRYQKLLQKVESNTNSYSIPHELRLISYALVLKSFI